MKASRDDRSVIETLEETRARLERRAAELATGRPVRVGAWKLPKRTNDAPAAPSEAEARTEPRLERCRGFWSFTDSMRLH